MIDKIIEAFMEEARSREGDDLSWKMFEVLAELDAKLMDLFEQLNEDFMVWLPDDMEEIGKAKFATLAQEARKKHDRGNL